MIPTEPVVCPQGYIYDLEVIREHLQSSDRCPFTGHVLSEFSLQPVFPPPEFIYPRSGTATRSIPAILKLFRSELDQRALGRLSVESEMISIEQELSDLKAKRKGAESVIHKLLGEKQTALDVVEGLQRKLKEDSSVDSKRSRN